MNPLLWYKTKVCERCKERTCEVLTPGMIRRGDPAGITACLMAVNIMLQYDRALMRKIMREGKDKEVKK